MQVVFPRLKGWANYSANIFFLNNPCRRGIIYYIDNRWGEVSCHINNKGDF